MPLYWEIYKAKASWNKLHHLAFTIQLCLILAWGYNWVGLNDIKQDGVLKWTNGSPVTYARFAPEKADTHDNKDHCFIMLKTDGNLVNKPCHFPQTFVCEANYRLMFTWFSMNVTKSHIPFLSCIAKWLCMSNDIISCTMHMHSYYFIQFIILWSLYWKLA